MSREAWGDEGPEYGPLDAAMEAGWLDPTDLSKALLDVMNERDRQWNEENFDPAHDDKYGKGVLAAAGACYALYSDAYPNAGQPPKEWPWAAGWWKPKDYRRDLVRAAALLIAEIERIDRAEKAAKP